MFFRNIVEEIFMKKLYFSSIFILFISYSLSAQSIPFHAERLITDFRGAATNGESILCYGDYGIITYSEDIGDTWEQLNIGDENSIRKIEVYNGDYFGITQKALIVSNDKGLNWTYIDMHEDTELISMDIQGSSIYILTGENVLRLSPELNGPPVEVCDIDPDSLHSEIVSDGAFIYLNEGYESVLRYDLQHKTTDFNNIKNLGFTDRFSRVSNLKVVEDVLYAVIEVEKYPHPSGKDHYNFNNLLIKSYDRGENWELVCDSLTGTSCYNYFEGDFYILGPRPENKRLILDYRKIAGPLAAPEHINLTDAIERDIYYNRYQDDYAPVEIIQIDENKLLAVGKDKLIAFSSNGGRNWEIKSFFETFYDANNDINQQMYFLNKEIVYVPYFRKQYNQATGNNIYFQGLLRTYDGGATWLPQKYDSTFKIPFSLSQYLFREDGSGICLFQFSNEQLFSTDFGETFESYEDSLDVRAMQLSDRRPLRMADRDLFRYYCSEENNRFTKIFITDKFKIIDTIRIDSVSFKNLMMAEDSTIYALGLKQSDFQEPDDVFKWGHFDYRKYFIYRSTDKGYNWEQVPVTLPLEPELININNYKYYIDITEEGTYFDNSVVFPYRRPDGPYMICKYNIPGNRIDTIELKGRMPNMYDKLFEFDNHFFYVSNSKNLYYAKDETLTDLWDSTSADSWSAFNERIISMQSSAECGYATTGVYAFPTFMGGSGYNVNVVRFDTNEKSIVTDIAEKDKPENVALKASAAFPMPASDLVRCYISGAENIENIFVKVHDYTGSTVSQDVRIENNATGGVILNWDCSSVPPGFYMISIFAGTESICIPVIISR